MIDDSNKTEIIEQFLAGELTGDLLAEVSRRLNTDEGFRQEVALQQRIIEAMPQAGKISVRSRLQAMHQRMDEAGRFNNKQTGTHRWVLSPLRIGIAATLSLIAVVLWFALNRDGNDATLVFDTYFKPYPDVVYTSFRDNGHTMTEKEAAFHAYDQGDYLRSAGLFEQLLKDEKDETVLFYLGNAWLAAGNTKKAIDSFETYLAQYQEFAIEAKWYLALSYLKSGDTAKTKLLLNELSGMDNDFQEKATDLLEQLQ